MKIYGRFGAFLMHFFTAGIRLIFQNKSEVLAQLETITASEGWASGFDLAMMKIAFVLKMGISSKSRFRTGGVHGDDAMKC